MVMISMHSLLKILVKFSICTYETCKVETCMNHSPVQFSPSGFKVYPGLQEQ